MFRAPASRLISHATVHHTVFDHFEYEKYSGSAKSIQHESDLEKIFLEKASCLMATNEELETMRSLLKKVKSCVAEYISDKVLFGTVAIVSCHDIGSLKMATMLKGHSICDLMCVFSGPISQAQIDILNKTLFESLLTKYPGTEFEMSKNEEMLNIVISCSGLKVKLWPVSEKTAVYNPSVHVSKNILTFNEAAIKHVEWFCDNSSDNVVSLVLLLKDLRSRFDGFKPLTPWLICLLAHYCTSRTTDRSSVDLHSAFRRCLKYLASGLFLSSSVGIIDPCEPGNSRAHLAMSVTEQDLVCLTAQYLANVGSILGYDKVLELHNKYIEGPDGCIITMSEPIQV